MGHPALGEGEDEKQATAKEKQIPCGDDNQKIRSKAVD